MKRTAFALVLAGLTGCATPGVPSKHSIWVIENGYSVARDIKSGGVALADIYSAQADFRVRHVSCSAADPVTAVCSYDANVCLAGEEDSDHDGWCHRTAKYTRLDRRSDPHENLMTSDGWTVDRPR
jgi:hypothetical protein